MLWVPFTIAGAVAQVVRNAVQAKLTGTIGTLGATQVRFIFGLPFAALFLAVALVVGDGAIPRFTLASWAWIILGALAQIAATALMLIVMNRRAFGVSYAYIKTEPVLVAILGVVLLGDYLPGMGWAAIGLVTAGVFVISVPPREFGKLLGEWPMIALGLTAGGLFGLSSIAFRGGIEALVGESFVIRSFTALVASLTIQSGVLAIWLLLRDRAAFIGSLRQWRESFGAGFLGAVSGACWFTAFSLTPAANVRTVALIEVPVAALLSRRVTGRPLAWNEWLGLGIVMGGLALLLLSAAF